MSSSTTTIFRLAIVAALALALVAALFLFRDSGDDRITGSELQAMQVYFAEFDLAIARGDAGVAVLENDYPDAFEDVEQTKLWYAGFVDLYQELLDSLDALEAPEPIAEEMAEFIAAGKQLQGLNRGRLQQLNGAQDKAAIDAILANEVPFGSAYRRQYLACTALRGIAGTNGIFVNALAKCELRTVAPTAAPTVVPSAVPTAAPTTAAG